jgi:hypothetical protein
MKNRASIRILARETNPRGDLFARLMADLFVALGYDAPRLNIHKTGRELDLVASHRLERRRAIAECKATGDPIGGADINKFVGALDAEQDDDPLTGYFVSLGGFTETALEQERQRRKTKLVLLDGPQIVDQLIEGRILIPKELATNLAGRVAGGLANLVLDPHLELLGHERGWFWVVYYLQSQTRTHFALIRSDGEFVSREIADELIAADRECAGVLYGLKILNLENSGTSAEDTEKAINAYHRYIGTECGFIQLDGMPADAEVASHHLKLEALFVPMYLDILRRLTVGHTKKRTARRAVGSVLRKNPRIALLAPPGGGKSTLLKRLAIAYSDRERRDQLPDGLPARDWLPLFIRCRDLRAIARGTFSDMLDALCQQERLRAQAAALRRYIDRELFAGRILLLVDGIDEIADPGDRAACICTLRATLLAYPQVATVISSREAGFRHIAAHLDAVCTRTRLSPFDANDIKRLTLAWSRQIDGDREEIRKAAEQLAETIVGNDRIQRLASNPLLLTTLLLVKRWVGTLPTRRAALYGKAVEVLLMTWNVEGHEPIPEEVALPQLCYVAWAMMESGLKEISRPRLAALLRDAREAMPVELGHVQSSVDDFIRRVEDRSSLLMMTGHAVEDGQLVEFFEFRHLTFQEFLAARAAVQGWHRRAQEAPTLASSLEPHLDDEAWREVVPLAAAMGGKAADEFIQKLTQRARTLQSGDEGGSPESDLLFLGLGNCLADEAPGQPATIRAALHELIRLGSLDSVTFGRPLALGRYGGVLRDEAEDAFLAGADLRTTGRAWGVALYWQAVDDEAPGRLRRALDSFKEMLGAADRARRCAGALGLAALCPKLQDEQRKEERVASTDLLRDAGDLVVSPLYADDVSEQWAAAWAMFELASFRVWAPPADPDALGRLFSLWQHSRNGEVRRMAGWALARQQICMRDTGQRCATVIRADLDQLLATYEALSRKREQPAVLAAAWYSRAMGDEELASRAKTLLAVIDDRMAELTVRELLRQLGVRLTDGERV